jgi:CRISPR/Cas system-associated protein Csm6
VRLHALVEKGLNAVNKTVIIPKIRMKTPFVLHLDEKVEMKK